MIGVARSQVRLCPTTRSSSASRLVSMEDPGGPGRAVSDTAWNPDLQVRYERHECIPRMNLVVGHCSSRMRLFLAWQGSRIWKIAKSDQVWCSCPLKQVIWLPGGGRRDTRYAPSKYDEVQTRFLAAGQRVPDPMSRPVVLRRPEALPSPPLVCVLAHASYSHRHHHSFFHLRLPCRPHSPLVIIIQLWYFRVSPLDPPRPSPCPALPALTSLAARAVCVVPAGCWCCGQGGGSPGWPCEVKDIDIIRDPPQHTPT